MRIKAHPTTYKGTRFRSRLEARWAAFFDLAGWQWQYEPSDYEGWSPDFLLIGKQCATPVEVKPIEWLADPEAMCREAINREDLEKVRRLNGREILVLGSYPLAHSGTAEFDAPFLGLLWSEWWQCDLEPSDIKFDFAVLWSDLPRGLEFAAVNGCFAYRISGQFEGDHHLRPIDANIVAEMWAKAGAATQWRAPKQFPASRAPRWY